MKRLILLLTFLLSLSLYSQDLARVFMPFLPEKVLTNADYKRVAMLELEKKAKLHPDLIAYYINYLENLFAEQPIEGNVTASHNSMIQAEQKYLIQRNTYLEKQIALLQERYAKHDLTPYVSQYFKRNIADTYQLNPTNSAPIAIDPQRQDFFALLYYKQTSAMKFDPNIDYSTYRRDAEKLKYRQLRLYNQKLKENAVKPNASEMDQLLDNWHILNQIEGTSNPVPLAIETAYRAFGLSKSSKPIRRVSLGAEYYPVNTSIHFNHELHINDVHKKYFCFNNPNIPQIGASLNAVLLKSKYLRPLGYLAIKARWSMGLKSVTIHTPSLDFDKKYNHGVYHYHEVLTFTENAITLDKINMYSLTLSTPLYFFHPTLVLEAELGAALHDIDYTVAYQFGYKKTEGFMAGTFFNMYWYEHTIEKISKTEPKQTCHLQKILFIPALHLRYQPINNLSFTVTGHINAFSCSIQLSI